MIVEIQLIVGYKDKNHFQYEDYIEHIKTTEHTILRKEIENITSKENFNSYLDCIEIHDIGGNTIIEAMICKNMLNKPIDIETYGPRFIHLEPYGVFYETL